MRKVKLLALLLAALMVVAAFAGCANTEDIEKDVADLDERVSALEGKIDANQKANEEQIKALTTLVEALTASQTEIKNSVDANKAAADANKAEQAASNQAILDAIAGLTGKLDDLEKGQDKIESEQAAKDQAAESEKAEAEKNEQETAAKQTEVAGKIAVLKQQVVDNKTNYFVDQYEELLDVIGVAENDVNAAKTAAAVEAAYDKLLADVAAEKFVAIDDKLYNYFVALWTNITEDNRALNEEVQDFIQKAEDHYVKLHKQGILYIEDALSTEKISIKSIPAVKNYVYAVSEVTGNEYIINLAEMLDVIDDVYAKGETINLVFEKKYYAALESDRTVYSLAKAAKLAKNLDTSIGEFVNNPKYEVSYRYLIDNVDRTYIPAVYSIFSGVNARFEEWCAFVLPLSEENQKMITHYEDMIETRNAVDNYVAAEKALKDLGEYNYSIHLQGQAFENLFLANDYDVFATNKVFYADYDNDGDNEFATEAIFNVIDAIVAEWAAKFNLNERDQIDMIEDVLGIEYDSLQYNPTIKLYEGVNTGYAYNKAYAAHLDAKYAAFKTDIVPLVNEMNKQDAIELSAYVAYDALTAGLAAWHADAIVLGEGTTLNVKEDTLTKVFVDIVGEDNYDLIVAFTEVIGATDFKNNNEAYGDPLDLVVFRYPIRFEENTSTGLARATDTDVLRTFFSLVVDNDSIPVTNAAIAAGVTSGLAPNYQWFKQVLAAPINDRIEYEWQLFNEKKLYSIMALLQLEDETIVLTADFDADGVADDKAYVGRDDAILTLKKGIEGDPNNATEFIFNNRTELANPEGGRFNTTTKKYELTGASVPATMYDFNNRCVMYGFADLASHLCNKDRMEELVVAFNNRVVELEAAGATEFQALLAEVENVKLYTDAANGMRTINSKYDIVQNTNTPNLIYYVTLSEYNDYKKAVAKLDDWIENKGGNVEYKKLVPMEVVTEYGVYTTKVFEYVIGNESKAMIINMDGQFVQLNKAATALKQHFDALTKWNKTQWISGDKEVDWIDIRTADIKDAAVCDYKAATKTEAAKTYYFKAYNEKTELLTEALTGLEAIQVGYTGYKNFEILNADIQYAYDDVTGALVGLAYNSELYVKNYMGDTWKNIEFFILTDVKAQAYTFIEAVRAAGQADSIAKVDATDADKLGAFETWLDMLEGYVINATSVYGDGTKAVEYAISNIVAEYGQETLLNITLVDETGAPVAFAPAYDFYGVEDFVLDEFGMCVANSEVVFDADSFKQDTNDYITAE